MEKKSLDDPLLSLDWPEKGCKRDYELGLEARTRKDYRQADINFCLAIDFLKAGGWYGRAKIIAQKLHDKQKRKEYMFHIRSAESGF